MSLEEESGNASGISNDITTPYLYFNVCNVPIHEAGGHSITKHWLEHLFYTIIIYNRIIKYYRETEKEREKDNPGEMF